MKITVITADEQFITVDVDPNESVENVKALLEVETSVPLQQQQLLFNGKEIGDSDRLSSIGVRENDMVVMVSRSARTNTTANDLSLNPDGSAVNPAAFQQQLRRDSQTMAQLLQALMYADPFDVESQKKIEAAIRQKGIDENWENALEHNPEAFARVVMLYVDMEVNGVPIKAFVDSGAQSTIISKSCAERCGLLRLLDQRYKGIAIGVGQSEILGRIHVAPLKCTIDLKDNVLRVGGGEVSVPFLQGTTGADHTQGVDFEAKITKLVELGFDRAAAIQALKLFNGNEEQAAGFLFGG
ncbi:hypothetical protein QJS10_CPB17g00336 [Acorus calamus]|uniref:DNA damage-inducible protein 1 n=1 Tax=Acorus calamus TaxID=4465 RepID=A0AAV9CST2_ACOCL|nr:hypothetical protein QJS10_CPB17g00336 [Acorus calamus]